MFEPSCNMYEIVKIEEEDTYPKEYKESKDEMVLIDDTPAHQIKEEKIRYEETMISNEFCQNYVYLRYHLCQMPD